MTENTLQAIHDAIQAHVTAEEDGMVTDWFLGFASVRMAEIGDDNPLSVTSYATSENTAPHAAYGVSRLATKLMLQDTLEDEE